MINPNNVYGKYQTATLTPEEAVLRLHEKLLERMETIEKAIKTIQSLEPKDFEKKKENLELISKELELILESVDAIKGMLSEETPEELKKKLESVYNIFKVTVIVACYHEDTKKLNEARKILLPLYEGWKEYVEKS
ncbi:MAG: flagellar protein FliS [Desulfurobacteriaceae bacterium]